MQASDRSLPPAAPVPVGELVRLARMALEARIPLTWIAGELSNLTRAASGHLYFTLKDEGGQLRCAMWRNRAQLLPFQLTEGMHVEVRALLTIYEPRGDLQLSVENVRRAGLGALHEAYLKLKARLAAEGLFDEARRRPLPRLPAAVGIVTSPQAAALQDVLATLRRRAPALRVVLYPAAVQGDGAGARIAEAIATAGSRCAEDGIEVLIVCRGGGSLEDLWAFNEEAVARAIHRACVPVVCGVGHETDTTLADCAADLRAATPTAAAEAVSAGIFALRQSLPQLEQALKRSMTRRLREAMQTADWMEQRLLHPRTRLQRAASSLNALEYRLRHGRHQHLRALQHRLAVLSQRLARQTPQSDRRRHRLEMLGLRLAAALSHRHAAWTNRLASLGAHLEHINPHKVLERGYAIVSGHNGAVLRDAQKTTPGNSLTVILARGGLTVRVESVTPCIASPDMPD